MLVTRISWAQQPDNEDRSKCSHNSIHSKHLAVAFSRRLIALHDMCYAFFEDEGLYAYSPAYRS